MFLLQLIDFEAFVTDFETFLNDFFTTFSLRPPGFHLGALGEVWEMFGRGLGGRWGGLRVSGLEFGSILGGLFQINRG